MTLGSATLTGTVTAEDGGNPLPAIIDVLAFGIAHADGTGSYALTNVPAGDHTVTASSPKFKSQTVSIQVSVHQVLDQDFVLLSVHPPRPPV
jgi:hypothetical protein